MKKFLLVNYSPIDKSEEYQDVPYLWMTLHSYFKRNSENPSAWNWLDPVYSTHANSPEELVERIVSQEPDVLGISCYIWNNALTLWVAEQVKLKLPNVKIIAGGPSLTYWKQQDWFKTYWFIDLVCTYTGYGEVFITDYLDGKKPKEIAHAVYPDLGRTVWNESPVTTKPKEFSWAFPYKDNIEYLKRFKQNHKDVKIIIDSSRGCPYGCVFCEWGGGTSTKVTFKPHEDVIEELELAFEILQPKYVDVNNANFGIVKEDVLVAKRICELHAQYGCVRDVNMYGPTKTNKQRLKEIMELFAASGIIQDMKLSIQSTNKTILDNIKRVDMPYDEQKELFISVAQDYNIPIKFEVMMGLPGETIDTYYKTISDIVSLHSLPLIHEWILLDSSPADREPYYSNMKLKTKQVRYHKHTFLRHVRPKGIEQDDTGLRNIGDDLVFKSKELPRYVVGSYSYTPEDWVEMQVFKYMINSLYRSGTLVPFMNIVNKNNIPVDEFFKSMFREYLLKISLIKAAYDKMLKEMDSDDLLEPYYADVADNLPLFSYYGLLKFVVLLNPKGFYEGFGNWLADKYQVEEFRSAGIDIGSRVKTPIYDSTLNQRQKISAVIAECQMIDRSLID